MKHILLATLLLSPAAAVATCPDNPPRTEAHETLMQGVAQAENEMEARLLTNQLWEIWSTAPDETAQEILQRGMERRAGYDFAGAIKDFDTLIEYCPDYAEGYNQRAFVNFIRGDYEISLADLDRAVEITPDHIGAVVGRALALMQLGRNREGQLALRDALKLNPWLPERNRIVPLTDVEDTAPTKEL
jgi:tetratricopeptide (TPR) repeat protein